MRAGFGLDAWVRDLQGFQVQCLVAQALESGVGA